MKVLSFGSLNIDYVYHVNHIVSKGETISSASLDTIPGGKRLNQSIALAKAGEEVYHAGRVGNGCYKGMCFGVDSEKRRSKCIKRLCLAQSFFV